MSPKDGVNLGLTINVIFTPLMSVIAATGTFRFGADGSTLVNPPFNVGFAQSISPSTHVSLTGLIPSDSKSFSFKFLTYPNQVAKPS